MTIEAGSKLGPYEIVAPLGAGGMGEVWKALDPRIGREVAIKILHPAMSADEELVKRFEQEARTVGQLNHPNLIAVYDVGEEGEIAYLVTELLEGDTLRERLSGGAMPTRRAIEWGAGIASGLAAAHEKGIVHRDLKPENVFVTKDNRVKILDFGLARLTNVAFSDSGKTNAPTDQRTDPGKVMGTVGYMSPEQVRAQPVDHRSDIFSFGAILYEMLTGVRAFRRDSSIETMNAILKEEPPELTSTNPNLHPGLERIVRHCLEKHPEARFQSAKDVAFDLESLSASSVSSPSLAVTAGRRRIGRRVAGFAGVLLIAAASFWAGSWYESRNTSSGSSNRPKVTKLERLTFRRGNIIHARLTRDGKTAVYSAAWDGKPMEVFTTQLDDRIERPLGIEKADVLSVSSKGEILILLKENRVLTTYGRGTLARVPLGGGVPRELLEDVQGADWGPNGEDFAVVRYDRSEDEFVLEYPIGTELVRSGSSLHDPAVSPDGKRVAFFGNDVAGLATLDVVGPDGVARTLLSPVSSDVPPRWVNETQITTIDYISMAQRLVDLDGGDQTLLEATTTPIQDVTPGGVVLLEREIYRSSINYGEGGATAERHLGWLDSSRSPVLSPLGQLLFNEDGEGGGERGQVYVRNVDGSTPVMISEGRGTDLSRDGKWIAVLKSSAPDTLFVVPTGAGRVREVKVAGMTRVLAGRFVANGRRILVGGVAENGASQLALFDLDTSNVSDLEPTPGGTGPGFLGTTGRQTSIVLSPAGERIAFERAEGGVAVRALEGGTSEPLRGSEVGDIPITWSDDGRTIWVVTEEALPKQVYAIDVESGRRSLWKELAPADLSGVIYVDEVSIAPDGNSWAYSYSSVTDSDLYTATLTGIE